MSTGRTLAAEGLLAALCLLLPLAGCENLHGRGNGQAGDPLTGGPPLPQNNPPAATAGAAPLTSPAGPLPPLPAPASTTSPAALTSGGANPALDPGMRIGSGTRPDARRPGRRRLERPRRSSGCSTPTARRYRKCRTVQPRSRRGPRRRRHSRQLSTVAGIPGRARRDLAAAGNARRQWRVEIHLLHPQPPNAQHSPQL